MKDPTLKRGEKVVTKVALTVRAIVKNPALYVKSQCMNLYPFLTTSYDPYLFNVQCSKHPLNIFCCMSMTLKTKINVVVFFCFS
jgi:hypothetical protein